MPPGLVSLADLQFARRDAEVDLDDAIDHPHGVRVNRIDRWKRLHLTGEEVEPSAMTWALHATIVKLALAERAAIVRADVVDGSPRVVHGVPHCERPAFRPDDRHLAGFDVVDRRDGPPARTFLLRHTYAEREERGRLRGAGEADVRTRVVRPGAGNVRAIRRKRASRFAG